MIWGFRFSPTGQNKGQSKKEGQNERKQRPFWYVIYLSVKP
jgi:hypothetical protein